MISQKYLTVVQNITNVQFLQELQEIIPERDHVYMSQIVRVLQTYFTEGLPIDYKAKDMENVCDYVYRCAYLGIGLLMLLGKKSALDITAILEKLHSDKNAGYSGNNTDPWYNFRQCTIFGISTLDGIMTRLSDKYTRFMMLWTKQGEDRVGEALTDTLLDFIAYCLIAYVVAQE